MAVDDFGIEVLKKSGEQVTPGDKTDYYIKTGVIGRRVLSQENSSTTPLGAAGSFTGQFIDILDYSNISVAVHTDVDSAIPFGLIVEWSMDGVVVDDTDSYKILANASKQFSYGSMHRFFRIRYVNGASPQGVFRLQTILHPLGFKYSSHRVDNTVADEDDAELVKAVITGKKEDGSYGNVVLSDSGSAEVAITDRPSEVRSRVRVEIPFENIVPTAGGVTIYTVTSGFNLYISSILITSVNTAAAIGRFQFRDDTTAKVPLILTERITGTAAGTSAPSPSLPEPIIFSTNINVQLIAGTIQTSGFFIGYEEPI